jgi:hypothetical protein
MCRIENRSRHSRWLEKLESCVPPEVMLIVVGNMLDKVKVKSSPLITIILPDTRSRTHAFHSHLGILSTSAHIRRRSVRSADGMSICRGVRQDGLGCDRGVQQRSLRASSIPPRRGMRRDSNHQEGPQPPTPPPLVDRRAVTQPRVCRGISICPSAGRGHIGRALVLAVRRLFFS